MARFSPAGAYNGAATIQPFICQFAKNAYSISAVLVDGYARAGRGATDSMDDAMAHVQRFSLSTQWLICYHRTVVEQQQPAIDSY
jgi:hypothetical protein